MREVVIDDTNKLIEAACAPDGPGGSSLWFRGQAKEWPLRPEVYRKDLLERNLTNHFKRQSRSRHRACPADTEIFAWLTLMRHYGLPTRLLDWSESILVAAFFAVEKPAHYNTDGVLFALYPGELNKSQHGDSGLPVGSAADGAARGAFFKEQVENSAVVAVLPDEVDPRMMVQQSAFTIHGSKLPLEETPGHGQFLFRFRIPADAKAKICNQLRLFGIKRSTLFPDLENLARDLVAGYHPLDK